MTQEQKQETIIEALNRISHIDKAEFKKGKTGNALILKVKFAKEMTDVFLGIDEFIELEIKSCQKNIKFLRGLQEGNNEKLVKQKNRAIQKKK